ncbi:MAG TPA: hypothetical protein VNN77_04685 [candidate division Zixibacteria bacterium]|nr:hypothetical protein [candidate division Zixibacteria bacterium]
MESRNLTGKLYDKRSGNSSTGAALIRVGPLVRDVVIVWALTAMGGFAVGVITGGPSADPQGFARAVAVSNFFLGVVAFAIIGCLAPQDRWRHLRFVAAGAWVTSLINVVFFGVTVAQWLGGAIFLAIVMGIGGAISGLVKRNRTAA